MGLIPHHLLEDKAGEQGKEEVEGSRDYSTQRSLSLNPRNKNLMMKVGKIC